MVRYSSHVLNRELIVRYLSGKKIGNQMSIGYLSFYHGCQSNGSDQLISNHLNTEQVKVRYSGSIDKINKISFTFHVLLNLHRATYNKAFYFQTDDMRHHFMPALEEEQLDEEQVLKSCRVIEPVFCV